MIPLEHLHVVDVICQEGSFIKASERLFKARSAVSYSVKKVEEFYQIELFDRNTYRPELTRNGQLLIHKIQHLMKEVRAFDEYARQMGSEAETELKIGISSIFPVKRVTALLEQLKKDFPNTIINLEIETSSGERLLMDEKVDIGIYGGLNQNPNVLYRRIDTFQLPVFVSDKFPVKPKNLSATELAKYPQVVLKASYKSGPTFGILEKGIQWYVSDHNIKKELIRNGLGWGRIPINEVKKELKQNKLIKVDSLEEMKVPAYVARLKEKSLGPVGMAVWNFFEEQ